MKIILVFASIVVIYLVFNVGYVEERTVVEHGIALETELEFSKYRKALESAKIPINYESRKDGRYQIYWDANYDSYAQDIVRLASGVPPQSYNGVCFNSNREVEKLNILLSKSNIKSVAIDSHSGQKCLYWHKKLNEEVLKVYPRFKYLMRN